jgi:hypothetical protein
MWPCTVVVVGSGDGVAWAGDADGEGGGEGEGDGVISTGDRIGESVGGEGVVTAAVGVAPPQPPPIRTRSASAAIRVAIAEKTLSAGVRFRWLRTAINHAIERSAGCHRDP